MAMETGQPILEILIFVTGTCIGSFLNVCISRLPAHRSIVTPGSACPKCGHRLSWWENIPLISYLVLKGRCRSCEMGISVQYPLVELVTGLLSLLLFRKFGLSIDFLIYLCFTAALIVIIFIDLWHQIIPDIISLPGILIGFLSAFVLANASWTDSLAGIIAGGGSLFLVAWGYRFLTGREGMGGGDIKLLAMIGAFLGWQAIPVVIFLSAVTGSIVGIAALAFRGANRHTAIPYGPFLAGGAMAYLFWGKNIVGWYLNLVPAIYTGPPF